MRKLPRLFILGFVLAFTFLAAPDARTEPCAPADGGGAAVNPAPTGQAPDDATSKITTLVHAGRYSEAQQLTTGLLLVYPNDQRLIKAKALIDKLLAPPGPASAAPGGSQSAANPNAEQLAGMDKVDYNALIELARQAQQTIDLAEQRKLLQQFMDQSRLFLQKHPDQILLLQLRVATAMSLNDPLAGYETGQALLAMGAADSNDPGLLSLLGQLKNKGWLDKQGVEKAKELKSTVLVVFTGDAADDGVAHGKGGVARGDGGGNLSISLRSRIERDVTTRLQSRFPHAIIHVNTPEAGDPAVRVTINLHDTVWVPNCGLWWSCEPTVDSQLLVSVSTPVGPLVDRTFPIHIVRTVSTTFGGNFYDRLVAGVLPDWVAQAVLDDIKGVLDEGAVPALLVEPAPEPGLPGARSSGPTNPTPEPVASDVRSPAPVNVPAPRPAAPDVQSSAPVNDPAPVAAAAASTPNTTVLHVYRPHHLTAAAQKPYIYIDGRKITPIANSQDVRMLLTPGKHTITVSKKYLEDEVPINDLDMGAGKEYWVRVEISAGAWMPHLKLYVVPGDQAQSESKRMEEIRIGDVSVN